MKYVSTRGKAPSLGFFDTTLAGLARDGGLYVPEVFPQLDIQSLEGKHYLEVAEQVILPFVESEFSAEELRSVLKQSYASFESDDIAPLHKLQDNFYVMELFHGPTLAFKDVALQFLGNVFECVLAKRKQSITIVGATSGDTGSAAISAIEGRDNINIFIMHPYNRVSEVQRRQMTTVLSPNVFNIAVEGSFDDCQDIVKALFNDQEFRDEVHLSAINSINWARIMAQVVYYVYASVQLQNAHGKHVTFCVPTGNFGNVYAGYIAKQMGAPIAKLVVATNQNDILHRFFESGEMKMNGVEGSMSPSMDIQISSNFERLLFELYGRDSERVDQTMQLFRSTGAFTVEKEAMVELKDVFASGRRDDTETLEIIKEIYQKYNYTIDPHTAVGVGVSQSYQQENPESLIVSLATAHPAKFPEAVEKATGTRPQLPKRLEDLYTREERFEVAPAESNKIKEFIQTSSGKNASKAVI